MGARAERTVFVPVTRSMRHRIEETIEQLIGLLDEIDADPDLEPDSDAEPDNDTEPNGDEFEDDDDRHLPKA